MNKPPAFQFYPKDWLDFRVQRMSFEAQGVYMKILCFMWSDSKNQCSILNDDQSIEKAIGLTHEEWMKIKSEILNEKDPILIQKNDHLISKRLKRESTKQRNYRKTQSERGKMGGKPRKSHGLTTDNPEGKPEKALQSSSLSSSLSLIKKNLKNKTFLSDSIEFRLAEKLWNYIVKRNPDHKPPNLQSWAKEIDLMIRIDLRKPDAIKEMIELCQENHFWQKNILSARKLREKYDDLNHKLGNIKPKRTFLNEPG